MIGTDDASIVMDERRGKLIDHRLVASFGSFALAPRPRRLLGPGLRFPPSAFARPGPSQPPPPAGPCVPTPRTEAQIGHHANFRSSMDAILVNTVHFSSGRWRGCVARCAELRLATTAGLDHRQRPASCEGGDPSQARHHQSKARSPLFAPGRAVHRQTRLQGPTKKAMCCKMTTEETYANACKAVGVGYSTVR